MGLLHTGETIGALEYRLNLLPIAYASTEPQTDFALVECPVCHQNTAAKESIDCWGRWRIGYGHEHNNRQCEGAGRVPDKVIKIGISSNEMMNLP